jgi:hypothetical protein
MYPGGPGYRRLNATLSTRAPRSGLVGVGNRFIGQRDTVENCSVRAVRQSASVMIHVLVTVDDAPGANCSGFAPDALRCSRGLLS